MWMKPTWGRSASTSRPPSPWTLIPARFSAAGWRKSAQAPINVQNVITYDIVIEVSNPDLKLFPGMTANVTIFTGHVSNALRIPKAALRFHPRAASKPGRAGVIDADGLRAGLSSGQPQAVQVKTGISDANHVEAFGGDLAEGQEVITGHGREDGRFRLATAGNRQRARSSAFRNRDERPKNCSQHEDRVAGAAHQQNALGAHHARHHHRRGGGDRDGGGGIRRRRSGSRSRLPPSAAI